jgi:hypothetical protein
VCRRIITQVPSLLAPGHWYRYSGRTVASPRLRPRSKPAGLRRADLTSLAPIFYRISRMIGARSSGHLRTERSRGQFLASMRIGACESAPASRCALIIAVCKPAGLASRAASETPVTALLRYESQLRHGQRRLCMPCRGRRTALSFPACCGICQRPICFADSAAAYSRVPKWIRRLHKWIHRLTATAVHK